MAEEQVNQHGKDADDILTTPLPSSSIKDVKEVTVLNADESGILSPPAAMAAMPSFTNLDADDSEIPPPPTSMPVMHFSNKSANSFADDSEIPPLPTSMPVMHFSNKSANSFADDSEIPPPPASMAAMPFFTNLDEDDSGVPPPPASMPTMPFFNKSKKSDGCGSEIPPPPASMQSTNLFKKFTFLDDGETDVPPAPAPMACMNFLSAENVTKSCAKYEAPSKGPIQSAKASGKATKQTASKKRRHVACWEIQRGVDADGKETINGYTILEKIGKGAFGKVRKASRVATSTGLTHYFAFKEYPISRMRRKHVYHGTRMSNMYEQVQHEVDILGRFSPPHRNCLMLFLTIEDMDEDRLILVTEYLPGGELMLWNPTTRRYTRRGSSTDPYSEGQAQRYFCDVVSALRYLHFDQQIVHRDIKPSNCLLSELDRVVLCDFGIAAHVGPDSHLRGSVGTMAFFAPEVIDGLPYDGFSAELWSCGVLLYCMMLGKLPFIHTKEEEMLRLIKTADTPLPDPAKGSPGLSAHARDLLQRLLTKKPEQRITLDEVLKHDWVELPLRDRIADGDKLVAMAKLRMAKKQEEGRRAVAASSVVKTPDPSIKIS